MIMKDRASRNAVATNWVPTARKQVSAKAHTTNLLRIIEAVGAALSEMKRAGGRAVNAQDDLTG